MYEYTYRYYYIIKQNQLPNETVISNDVYCMIR